jgi:hypothetical protein
MKDIFDYSQCRLLGQYDAEMAKRSEGAGHRGAV